MNKLTYLKIIGIIILAIFLGHRVTMMVVRDYVLSKLFLMFHKVAQAKQCYELTIMNLVKFSLVDHLVTDCS